MLNISLGQTRNLVCKRAVPTEIVFSVLEIVTACFDANCGGDFHTEVIIWKKKQCHKLKLFFVCLFLVR